MDQDITQDLKSFKIVYTALIIGVVFFLLVTIYLNEFEGGIVEGNIEGMNLFLIIGNILSIASITAGLTIFKKRLKNIESFEIIKKLETYRSAMIIRAATIEGSVFFFIIGYLLFGSNIFLYEAIALIFILSYFFPNNTRIEREMKHNLRDLKY